MCTAVLTLLVKQLNLLSKYEGTQAKQAASIVLKDCSSLQVSVQRVKFNIILG